MTTRDVISESCGVGDGGVEDTRVITRKKGVGRVTSNVIGVRQCQGGSKGKQKEREDAKVRQLGLAQTRGLGMLMQPLVGRSSLPDRRMYRYVTLGVLRSLPEPLRVAASRHSRLGGQQNMYIRTDVRGECGASVLLP